MVKYGLAKTEIGVRFSLAALLMSLIYTLSYKNFIKTVDKYVSNVYKGHNQYLSLMDLFNENTLKNKDILVKDIIFSLFVSRETKLIVIHETF